jgi:hypothetical protein
MTVVPPLTGTLKLVELQTEEQYAIVERTEATAKDELKWGFVNSVVALSSGTHLIHMRSILGNWTLSALCLQNIDSSNTCASENIITSSEPFVQEEAESIFGAQQEPVVVEQQPEEAAVEEQPVGMGEQPGDVTLEPSDFLSAPSEDDILGELSFVTEETNEGTSECTVFISANNYTAMDGISMLDSLTNTGAIGFLDPGDWFSYTLNVPQADTYELDMRVASPFGEGAFEVIDMVTQDVYATVDRLPITQSWEAWEIAFTLVTLRSGPISLMIRVLKEGWNMESLCLKAI